MHGTLVCGITDGAESDDAIELGVELSARLGLRLVLAHVVAGIPATTGGDGGVTTHGDRRAAERRLADLATRHGLGGEAERRVEIGEPATLLGRIAAEEAADVIVVGARSGGWRKRRLESPLAGELEAETPVPVVIAPPRARNGRQR
jgi:nucleotide-binding universal stress UspA family protein